ncbi:helix-turn-helix transcriptional regulator [Thiohalocapsa marina]|uniref:Helix-turn-helix transcriptional regulator n=1 Tax=Thiohalocapsa marina TaxID=424902 RepID=A0A5M8FIV6_9GAMM|nr:helix-turn-helix transcriptional regulator [Thiohalocapsa marina]KAA6184639.1 helix-turn-helix transcriptional regulator [Thiohalocapsa marina]
MNAPTDVQIIQHNGVPAFAVLPMAQYEALLTRHGGKRDTLPHAVVKLNVQQGHSLLKAWRLWLGWTQAELASRAKVTQAQVARFESGKGIPRADTLLRLSSAMGVMADLLWDDDGANE